jgi:dienelactone hydrolase
MRQGWSGRQGLRVVVMASVLTAVLVGGCSGSSSRHVTVTVLPAASLFDQPVHFQVTGLSAGERVTLRLSSADLKRGLWSSQATFTADGRGHLDLDRSPALSGSYQGVNPMGLIESMQPASPSKSDAVYFWGASQGFTLTVTAAGSTIATKSFSRRFTSPGVSVQDETLAATGFYGQYWRPAPGSPRRPAVLEFGGSEGGLSGAVIGAGLASAGYPTLDIAYFGEPGLPAALQDIPLEYFAGALRWLARQAQVLPADIYVSGGSRGSEAALLLGAHYPNLVHGVIANSPSDIAFGSYPSPGAAAWTFDGKPVPYSTTFSSVRPVVDPAADIAVQDIRGPVFLDCGTADLEWTSCTYAAAIQDRLAAAHDRYPHVLYRYVGAGHHVDGLIAYEPQSNVLADPEGSGETLLANAIAKADLWPNLLRFLANPAAQSGTFTIPASTGQ